jgi:hypothetical protein
VSGATKIERAERTLSLLGICMVVGYTSLVVSIVLATWLSSRSGQKSPLDLLVLLLSLTWTVALLLCPILIGMVASKIGKSAIIWGGLSLIFSPFGQLVGYFKIKSAVDEASTAEARAQFEEAISR